MYIEVGSYEAKTKLPELLRGVQGGNRYTITLRGEPVADLVPAQGNKHSDAAAAVDEVRSFMRSRKPVAGVREVTGVDVRYRASIFGSPLSATAAYLTYKSEA